MIEMTTAAATTATVTDAARTAALHEFSHSATQLTHATERVRVVTALVGQRSGGEWSGPAHDAFQLALDGFRSSLANAETLVASAHAEAMRTVRILGSHVG